MRVREAEQADVPGIRAVGLACWPATYGFAGQDFIDHGLATWWSPQATIDSLLHSVVLLAQDGEQIVAMASMQTTGPVPVIWKLYVLPGHRATGIGTALLEALIARLDQSAHAVELEYVDGNQAAASFYAARGFIETTRQAGEHPGWPATVWMRKTLTNTPPRTTPST